MDYKDFSKEYQLEAFDEVVEMYTQIGFLIRSEDDNGVAHYEWATNDQMTQVEIITEIRGSIWESIH